MVGNIICGVINTYNKLTGSKTTISDLIIDWSKMRVVGYTTTRELSDEEVKALGLDLLEEGEIKEEERVEMTLEL
jgi:hypothetical protein